MAANLKRLLQSNREEGKPLPWQRQLINTLTFLLIGITLGIISKFLDNTPINNLPYIFQLLDITNFLGRLAIWIFIALCISLYSNTALRSSINVFSFFMGMISSYYMYSYYIAGFFPLHYAMIRIALTFVSPILGYICRYAQGENIFSLILSSIILAVMFNLSFMYGSSYFDIVSFLELLTYFGTLVALQRKTIDRTIIMILLSIIIAVAFHLLFPFPIY